MRLQGTQMFQVIVLIGMVTLLCCTSITREHTLFAVTEHRPFVVIVPSYNNEAWVERNLRAIFEQKYDQYRVIYIDDASLDGTVEKVEKLVAEYGQMHRFLLIQNPDNRGALYNLRQAAQLCDDGEIVVICDGDDWLAHDHVLARLNEIYADPNVWMTYGSYIEYPTYSYTVANFAKALPEKIIKENSVRKFSKTQWCLSHLHTSYASLLKKIKEADLQVDGKYLDAAYDLALILPLIEMAGIHARFVDEILYIYNRANVLNDHKVRAQRQQQLADYILGLSCYEPLQEVAQ